MKKILVVIPTEEEAEYLLPYFDRSHLDARFYSHPSGQCDLVIPGVGAVNLAFELGKRLSEAKGEYDFLLHGGIAGSYSTKWELGSVVEVTSDRFADFGVKMGEQFVPLRNRGFPMDASIPEAMENFRRWFPHLPSAKGTTWNFLTTNKREIQYRRVYFHSDIETMENGVVFYVGLKLQMEFATIRAISNYVGEMERKKWKMKLAKENLTKEIIQFVEKQLGILF